MPLPAWLRIGRFSAPGVMALLLVASGVGLGVLAVGRPGPSAQTADVSAAAVDDNDLYVSRVEVWPQLTEALSAAGDRLEKRDKERLTLLGTISRPREYAERRALRLVLELPGRLRLEEQDGSKTDVTVFDGKDVKKAGKALKKEDEDAVESLVFDTVDNFFLSQRRGQTIRYLGSRFRAQEAGPVDRAAYYDLYEVGDHLAFKQKQTVRRKVFFFNSDTQLLERVRYRDDDGGQPVNVEVRFSGWSRVEGQALPTSVTRLENGEPVLILEFTSAALGRRMDDGIFALTARSN
jgi:hypothetical protein